MRTFIPSLALAGQLFASSILASEYPLGVIVQWGANIAAPYPTDPSKLASTNLVALRGQVLTNVVLLSAGSSRALALRKDGTVVGWGNNNVGQATGIPTTNRPCIGEGSVTIGGRILTNIAAIAAGGELSLALKRNGTVAAWGASNFGKPVEEVLPSGLSNVLAIAAGGFHNLALKHDRTVVWWGVDVRGEAAPPAGLSNVVAVSAGRLPVGNSLALIADGTVVRWGFDTTVPTGLSNVVAIAAGGEHCLALKGDGSVVAWGHNIFGEATVPAGLSNVAAISAGATHSLALKRDGTVVAWGDNRVHETNVPAGLQGVVAIAAGDGFSLAITTNAAVAERFRH